MKVESGISVHPPDLAERYSAREIPAMFAESWADYFVNLMGFVHSVYNRDPLAYSPDFLHPRGNEADRRIKWDEGFERIYLDGVLQESPWGSTENMWAQLKRIHTGVIIVPDYLRTFFSGGLAHIEAPEMLSRPSITREIIHTGGRSVTEAVGFYFKEGEMGRLYLEEITLSKTAKAANGDVGERSVCIILDNDHNLIRLEDSKKIDRTTETELDVDLGQAVTIDIPRRRENYREKHRGIVLENAEVRQHLSLSYVWDRRDFPRPVIDNASEYEYFRDGDGNILLTNIDDTPAPELEFQVEIKGRDDVYFDYPDDRHLPDAVRDLVNPRSTLSSPYFADIASNRMSSPFDYLKGRMPYDGYLFFAVHNSHFIYIPNP